MRYVTVQGDAWDWIAKRVYGDQKKLLPLMEANPAHLHTVIFDAGVVLNVPDVPSTSPAASVYVPPWIGGGS